MIMSFENYDKLTERLEQIENVDTGWLPEPEDLEERLCAECDEDVCFMIWLSLTAVRSTEKEMIEKRRSLMAKLYRSVVLTE